MRASSLVLGPLVARTGMARVAMPGGCAIGGRPIDLHIKGLEKMGAIITQEHGYLEARAERLHGAHIVFDKITVTGTEDLLMAAVLAEGETALENCAREPEVTDLAALLTAMGAKIEGAGTATIRVQGVTSLHGARTASIPTASRPEHFSSPAPSPAETSSSPTAIRRTWAPSSASCKRPAHASTFSATTRVRVRSEGKLKAADISTEEYPGFPTDMQAQYMALATQAEGVSSSKENIFENRFMHVQELVRMGANIKVDGRTATVRGRPALLRRRHVFRPARLRFARAGRPGRRRRIHPRPRLPHGPRLRAH